MLDDPPPPRSKDLLVARLRAWGTLVTAAAGLATALWKPQDQSVTKAAYEQCAAGIEKLNDGLAEEHQELAALRGYIAAKEGQSLISQPPPAESGAPVLPPPPPPLRRVQGAVPKPTMPASTTSASPPAAAAAAEPPPAAPAPAAFHPADFDSVLKSVK